MYIFKNQDNPLNFIKIMYLFIKTRYFDVLPFLPDLKKRHFGLHMLILLFIIKLFWTAHVNLIINN